MDLARCWNILFLFSNSDDNCYEIDLVGTKQYGDKYEIKEISDTGTLFLQ